MFDSIIDANRNRVSEGLRVIEDYARFVRSHHELTNRLSTMRQSLWKALPQETSHLSSRDTQKDTRSEELPPQRQDLIHLLTANFKRVQEGLRVLEEYTGDSFFNRCRYESYDLEKEVLLLAEKPQIKRGFYLISDDVSVLKQGLDWQVSLVQLRDKHCSKADYYQKAFQLKKLSAGYDTPIVINDYSDIALDLDVDGFHSGQDDLPITVLRRLFGETVLLGRTTHTLEQGVQAQKEGVDYVSIGPIWETPSKPGREGIGFSYLAQFKKALSIPCVAIGGIDASNFKTVLEYDPDMIGLIRSYQDIPSLTKVWQEKNDLVY